MQTTMETTTTRRTWIRSWRECFVSTISPDALNRRSRTGWDVASTTSSRISAGCCGSTRVHSLHRDNTCGGCHSPSNGFGDTQSIAIGVDNNGLVGPNRVGPRNQRRSPLVVNTAFYPKLMWNGRFFANPAPGKKLGDPFSNMFGFTFPAPEAQSLGYHDHLLQSQAHIPPTELVEVAGFTGTSDTDLSPRFEMFDNGQGLPVPLPDDVGFPQRADPAGGARASERACPDTCSRSARYSPR